MDNNLPVLGLGQSWRGPCILGLPRSQRNNHIPLPSTRLITVYYCPLHWRMILRYSSIRNMGVSLRPGKHKNASIRTVSGVLMHVLAQILITNTNEFTHTKLKRIAQRGCFGFWGSESRSALWAVAQRDGQNKQPTESASSNNSAVRDLSNWKVTADDDHITWH